MADHDPKGRRAFPMMRGMEGGASFAGMPPQWRLVLWRDWSQSRRTGRVLWVGMNPSTATATLDDPTIRREIAFTMAMGATTYHKCNVSAYRATFPSDLIGLPDWALDHPDNLPTVLAEAAAASRVVLAFGALTGRMRALAEGMVQRLRAAGVELWCMGTTKDGSPRHPLYLAGAAVPVRWEGWAR